MDSTIYSFSKTAEELTVNPREVLRYLGYAKQNITEEDIIMVEKLLPEAFSVIRPKACYGRFPLEFRGEEEIHLPYGWICSKDLTRNLSGCHSIFIFAATIGTAFDTLIKKKRLFSMADACVLQSIGAAIIEEFIEQFCLFLEESVKQEGLTTKPRYSPGFGDVPLENQRGVFQVLNPAKNAGITLMNTLIMSPEKSVTAYVGIKDKN